MPATPEISEWDLVTEALRDEYDVLEELGRGGMAIVYRARERLLEREVAVKVLPLSLTFDAEFVERFQREARTAAKLEHPNIIPIYRVGQSGRVIYFAMKFLRGRSLADLLAERGALAPAEVRRTLLSTAAALGYAHRNDIVHRDIKPDNIMFDESGHAVVTDFGIAKAATGTRLTGTGMSIGTPLYMSPEQARARALDGRSDLYSLGIVTYQCLTGQVPFDGEDAFAIGLKHIMEALPHPNLPTSEHRVLFDIVERMAAKDPGDRFQTAEELLAHLEQVGESTDVRVAAPSIVRPPQSSGQPKTIVTPPPAVPERVSSETPAESPHPVRRPRRTRRLRRVFAASAILLLVAGGAAAYWYVGLDAQWPLELGHPLPARLLADRQPDPAPQVALVMPSVATPADGMPLDSASSDSSEAADSATTAAVDSVAPLAEADTAATDSLTPAGGSPSGETTRANVSSYGVVVLEGLPRTARLSVNGASKMGLRHRVEAGSHLIEVRAEGYEPFSTTVPVSDGDTVPVRVAMTRISTPPPSRVDPCATEPPEADYFSSGTCYDTRPSPLRPPLVAVPAGASVTIAPVSLLVQVSSEGRPVQILRGRRQSADPGLILAAMRFVRDSLSFLPAQKSGSPIDAWARVTVRFRHLP